MPGALRRSGPAFISNSAANILSEPASGFHHAIKHIHIVNVGAASTFSLYLGATGGSAAGTQLNGGTRTIAANSKDDWYPQNLKQSNTEFLSGIAADASRLVITIIYELRPNES